MVTLGEWGTDYHGVGHKLHGQMLGDACIHTSISQSVQSHVHLVCVCVCGGGGCAYILPSRNLHPIA